MFVMATWGFFPFMMKTIPYSGMRRSREWKYASNPRNQRRDAHQFVGIGDDTIEIYGKMMPLLTQGRSALDILHLQADMAIPLPLIERNGRSFGAYFLTKITDDSTILEANGAPNEIDFSLSLLRDDEINNEILAAIPQVINLLN